MIQSIIQNISFIFASLISMGLLGAGFWITWKVSKRDSQISEQNKKMIENQEKIFKKVDIFEKQLSKVCDIVGYQFQKNGGGSTTDKIDRIEGILNEVAERQILDFYLDSQPKYECDSNGHCIRVNYAWCKITGLSEEESLGNKWMKAVHPKHRDIIKYHWDGFLNDHMPFEVDYILLNVFTNKEYLVKGRAIRNDDREGLHLIIGTFEILKESRNENLTVVAA